MQSQRLLMPRADAEATVTAQIQKGQSQISRQIVTDGDLNTALAEFHVWLKECTDLLTVLLISEDCAHFQSYSRSVQYREPHSAYMVLPVRAQKLQSDLQAGLAILQVILSRIPSLPSPARPQDVNVFVIHGHDEGAKHELARFITLLGMTPIILNELASAGRAIIEMLDASRDVSLAVALLTPDDIGSVAKPGAELRPRARQNVILELGFFMGALGRTRVVALHKDSVELPSDYHGILFIEMDTSGGWKLKLAREFHAAGVLLNLNLALG